MAWLQKLACLCDDETKKVSIPIWALASAHSVWRIELLASRQERGR